jgi:hypothetical protein
MAIITRICRPKTRVFPNDALPQPNYERVYVH